MKKWLTKITKAVPFSLLATLLVGTAVLAAAYSAPLTITETNGTAYNMLPVIADAPVQWMVDNDYMDADGLDTLVETAGGVTKPHMVAGDKVLTATAVPANSQTNLVFSTENTPLSSMDVITGYDGYITVDDDADLELGSNFEIEQKGYVDTDAGSDKNLAYKEDAFRTYIDGAESISSVVWDTATTETLAPSGVGSETNIPTLFGAATHWQACLTNDGDTSYVEQDDDAGWKRDLFATTDSAIGEGRINSVTIYVEAKMSAAAAQKVRTSILTNAVAYDGSDENLTVNYATYSTTYTDNPQTTDSWTWAEIDAMEIGVSLYDAGAGTARCTQVYAVVNYTPFVLVTATGVSSGEYTVQTSEAPGLHFDGGNDDLIVGAPGSQLYNTTATLECWIKLDDATQVDRAIMGQVSKHFWDQYGEGILYDNGVLSVISELNNDKAALTVALVDTTSWHHVVGIVRTASGELYLDGVLEDSGDLDSGFSYTFGIGASQDDGAGGASVGNYFDGLIAEARVYNRALSPTEVTEHYNGIFTDESDLIGFWKLDEGAGVSAADSSGEGNTGTITGATWDAAEPLIRLDIDSGDIRIFGEGGASVADNANDWKLNQNNVMPYMDYYKHTVSGVEHAWYQPNDIIVNTSYDGTADAGGDTDTIIDAELTQANDYWNLALVTITDTTDDLAPEGETAVVLDFIDATDEVTLATALTAGVDAGDTYTIEFGTLVDRQGGDENGRITWGVNPTGAAASLSSLVSEDQPGLATPIDEPARDVMPEIETSDWFVEPDVTGSLLTNPMRPLITMISDNTTLTELQTWRWLGIAVVLLIIVITARLVPKHLAIACFAGGAGTLLMVVMTIWPLWTLVLLILFALGGWVSERSPSV